MYHFFSLEVNSGCRISSRRRPAPPVAHDSITHFFPPFLVLWLAAPAHMTTFNSGSSPPFPVVCPMWANVAWTKRWRKAPGQCYQDRHTSLSFCASVASLTFTCRLQGVGALFGKSEGLSVKGSVMTGPLEVNVSWWRFKTQIISPPPSLPLSHLLSPKPPPTEVVLLSGLFQLKGRQSPAVCVTASLAASLVVSAPTGDTNLTPTLTTWCWDIEEPLRRSDFKWG